MNIKLQNLLIKNKLSILVSLFLGAIAFPVLFYQNKALAGYPSVYTYAVNLSLDSEQCIEKASKAASLILPRLEEPIVHEHGITQFGITKATRTTINCIQKSQGSTLTVFSSGDSWNDSVANEAESIRDRFVQVLSNGQ